MNANDDIKALEALEDRRQAAMLAGDLDTLGEILHDELTYVHSTGGIDTK